MKKKAFYTNYVDVDMPEDIFTQENININTVRFCIKVVCLLKG